MMYHFISQETERNKSLNSTSSPQTCSTVFLEITLRIYCNVYDDVLTDEETSLSRDTVDQKIGMVYLDQKRVRLQFRYYQSSHDK